MPGNDDETETANQATRDPALDATAPASDVSAARPRDVLDLDEQGSRVSFIGRYRVLAVLGSGGMGVVYRARDPELDRDLAIKVVRTESRTLRAQERLLEEARAMAKLRHPAVVPVFDVGTTSRGVFIVMPMIGGGTIHDWMKKPRPWREVVERFIMAGRGLAAAHAAGFVHRDFKPRNVLVSERGDVMVADFGIAARTDDSSDQATDQASSTPGTAKVSSIAGTPAYMAPEQATSATIDARADQYSFCISMWEALCGERPHDADTRTRGRLTRPSAMANPVGQDVPNWLLDALSRGFSASPDRRWSSMSALLDHIERRLRRPRRIAAAAGAAGLLVTAAAVGVLIPSHGDPCPDPHSRLVDAWTPKIRAEIERSFQASAVPYASDTIARVLPALDAYAASWRARSIAVCRATRVERTQSEVLMARRSSCLDRRLAALRARTMAFRAGKTLVVENAAAAVEELPPLDDCDNTDVLLAFPTPIAPELRDRVAALETRLDDIDALRVRRQESDQSAMLETAVAEARSLAYPPLLVRALELQALSLRGSARSNEPTLRALVQAAAAARDDSAVVRAWGYLIEDLSVRQGKLAEAKALEPVAEASLLRAGSPPRLRYELQSALAQRALVSDEVDIALSRWNDALGAATTPAARAHTAAVVAKALAVRGRAAEALPFAEDALRHTEAARGVLHPETSARRRLLDQIRAGTIAP